MRNNPAMSSIKADPKELSSDARVSKSKSGTIGNAPPGPQSNTKHAVDKLI